LPLSPLGRRKGRRRRKGVLSLSEELTKVGREGGREGRRGKAFDFKSSPISFPSPQECFPPQDEDEDGREGEEGDEGDEEEEEEEDEDSLLQLRTCFLLLRLAPPSSAATIVSLAKQGLRQVMRREGGREGLKSVCTY